MRKGNRPRFLFVIPFLMMTWSSASLAETCEMNAGEPLKVACTDHCPQNYVDALNRAAEMLGYTLEICTLNSVSATAETSCDLATVDALVSPGGGDADLNLYLPAIPEKDRARIRKIFAATADTGGDSGKARDQKELGILDQYFSDPSYQNLPFLGVCYGMQMLSIHSGIPLIVDLQTQLGIPARDGNDLVNVSTDSELKQIVGSATVEGLESHHQAVDARKLAANPRPDLKITAKSNGGRIVEAIEFSDRPAIGVQFHPERSNLELSNAIYGWVLERACVRHHSH